ncbi:ExbD/TolR family protein [Glacieibacterium frigidum]|uniref:Biopolymer transporter ExbD n=1 Tax=Glacieibacterium frigidum TaxID=2593303 RepID=A0A552UGX4_9SPHN|nr:biopolymer transporter ExbD [Glacieibacterium frigidum]TRW17483.1 biopolymer transporter ExbD [Glacieibacterium frigidum]
MAMTAAAAGNAPMMDINTTPLIDVMLVLLIMFIITIPLNTHAVKLDLPSGGGPVAATASNQIDIDVLGNVYWNQQIVDRTALQDRLRASIASSSEPLLRLRPDALARYQIVDEVMATVQRAGVTRIAFVGNEAYVR